MEYKIFKFLRHGFQIPLFIRFILASFLIFLSSIPIVLPIFPGSLLVGVIILVIGVLLIVPGTKIRHVVKLRKGIIYLMKNLHRKNTIEYKIKNIKSHVKDILKNK